jgi:hypothetical protein
MKAVIDPRITVVTGERRAGPNELIGVLEVRADGSRPKRTAWFFGGPAVVRAPGAVAEIEVPNPS